MRHVLIAIALVLGCADAALADRLHLSDGTSVEADEVWEDPDGVWYRRGGVSYHVERARVKRIERAVREESAGAAAQTGTTTQTGVTAQTGVAASAGATTQTGAASKRARQQLARVVAAGETHHAVAAAGGAAAGGDAGGVGAGVDGVEIVGRVGDSVSQRGAGAGVEPVTIYLVGGASFEVDEASETADGVWYKRGALSIFIDRARVERVERGRPVEVAAEEPRAGARRERRWTTGSARLDQLIRQNGARHGVDPYLIFLVMEQESHFNTRAVSHAGARGLMQLMPGTAARFGVRNVHDPAQNVSAGTRYLKQLMGKFNNRVDLVLAGYNAGEGNVRRYGYRVPPFRETRNYVRKISSRYGRAAHAAAPPREDKRANTTTAATKTAGRQP
jgi:Transglycosylase SLT domain